MCGCCTLMLSQGNMVCLLVRFICVCGDGLQINLKGRELYDLKCKDERKDEDSKMDGDFAVCPKPGKHLGSVKPCMYIETPAFCGCIFLAVLKFQGFYTDGLTCLLVSLY